MEEEDEEEEEKEEEEEGKEVEEIQRRSSAYSHSSPYPPATVADVHSALRQTVPSAHRRPGNRGASWKWKQTRRQRVIKRHASACTKRHQAFALPPVTERHFRVCKA